LILSCWTLPAQAVQLSPDWLTDMTGQITPETKRSINEISQKFQRENSLAIYTLVTNGTENGLDAHRYIQQVFRENQLTEKDTLVLLDISSRKVEIFSGLDSQVTDSIVQNAIAKAKPLLVQSNWNAGTIALVSGVVGLVNLGNNVFLVLFVILLIIVVIGVVLGSDSSSGSGGSYYSGGSSGSSGGGGGGDSF
jgi:uncharacterized membrane protein YgcG